MQQQHEQKRDEGHDEGREFPIFIDEVKYEAPAAHMTGVVLRSLPQPPIGPELDLWLETPGPKDDVLIRPEETYEVHPGSKFYTAPSTINPGGVSNVHS